jgi:hypothetical protein
MGREAHREEAFSGAKERQRNRTAQRHSQGGISLGTERTFGSSIPTCHSWPGPPNDWRGTRAQLFHSINTAPMRGADVNIRDTRATSRWTRLNRGGRRDQSRRFFR